MCSISNNTIAVRAQRFFDFMISTIAAIASKPATGVLTSGVSLILIWLHVLSPLVGFLTICVGFLAACYALVIKLKQNREEDLRIAMLQQQRIELHSEALRHFCQQAAICPNRKGTPDVPASEQ